VRSKNCKKSVITTSDFYEKDGKIARKPTIDYRLSEKAQRFNDYHDYHDYGAFSENLADFLSIRVCSIFVEKIPGFSPGIWSGCWAAAGRI